MLRSTAIGCAPVTQRAAGWPYGDCVQAAYSSLLGIPAREIPRFDPAALRAGEEQIDREREWLASLGLRLVEVAVPPEESLPQEILDRTPPVEHLMSGLAPRGLYHRVVGHGGRVLWDPHPSRAGLLTCYALSFVLGRDERSDAQIRAFLSSIPAGAGVVLQ